MAEGKYTCVGCGVNFDGHKRKYCSKKCVWTANDRRRGHRPAKEAQAYRVNPLSLFTCKICGKACKRNLCGKQYKGLAPLPQYCSRACRSVGRRGYSLLPSYSRVYPCVVCGKVCKGRADHAYCSDTCLQEKNRQRALDQDKNQYIPKTLTCLCCSKTFTTQWRNKHRSVCSVECQRKWKTRNPNAQAKKALRRALERGANGGERIYKKRVFERDGWRCQLCGCKTVAPHDHRNSRSAELDHIIPVSQGGTHTWDNVQCLCRACNGDKNDKPMGQLLMFGSVDARTRASTAGRRPLSGKNS